MVRPERFELPTLWFEGEIRQQHGPTQTSQSQQNIDNLGSAVGWLRTKLATVHGQNTDSLLATHKTTVLILLAATARTALIATYFGERGGRS